MKLRLVAAAAAALLGTSLPVSAASVSNIFVFGDSLVDAGNIYAATGGAIPSAATGYFAGRFSNGPTFVDILSQKSLGHYTTASLFGGDNYGFGGARAAGDDQIAPGVAIPGLGSQAGMYVAKYGPVADPNALYIINFGNNDVNAIESGDTEGLTTAQYVAAYVGNMAGAVAGLSSLGATKILIMGVPNPQDPVGVALQGQLDLALNALQPTLTANLYRFDYFNFFARVAAHPTAYGLTANVDFTTPCQVAVTPGPGMNCTGYFSFDGTHPTAPVHYAIAREISELTGVGNVPEPASWALMIAGFGMVGGAMRRRTHAIAA